MRDLFPILKIIKKQKTAPLLLALQMAVTLMVIVNAAFIITDRNRLMERSSGLDEDNIFYISSTAYQDDYALENNLKNDLEMIRNTLGVIDATPINAIPLSGGGWSMGLSRTAGANSDGAGSAMYMVDEHALGALGISLIAGEFFNASDIKFRTRTNNNWPPVVVITKALALELFPDDYNEALGETIYIEDNDPMVIKGIVDTLQAPWNGWSGVERSALIPTPLLFKSITYMIRTEPGQRDLLMAQIENKMSKTPGRFIRRVRDMSEVRKRSYSFHSATNSVLLAVITALTVVTGLGIVGQASFSVNKRKKQIGTRRALGANKGQIAGYFMLENAVITSFGIVLGLIASIGLNMVLVEAFSLPRLPWHYLVIGSVVLYILGQLAVAYPAQRASAVSPAIATRSA
ncbi:ABC transporter permease [Pseudoalteromonas denitrificans]|uniref:Putative ABC transport system permease protein n=1 Tax=Pseudoalteromonas denitrificans DSM 6059 TaxID=1123010 RepID=A0A1I1M2S4_9GAMM|nr:FtsX-like permease family protein [Pseudoalteromonas denitrificans]SFC79042.1 putative ABC transport system permease protein [Pseudoalteromonas denitrificans DSM 6059]